MEEPKIYLNGVECTTVDLPWKVHKEVIKCMLVDGILWEKVDGKWINTNE